MARTSLIGFVVLFSCPTMTAIRTEAAEQSPAVVTLTAADATAVQVVRFAKFSANGKRICILKQDGSSLFGSVSVHDTLTGAEIFSLNRSEGDVVRDFLFSPDGTSLAVSESSEFPFRREIDRAEQRIDFYDGRTGKFVRAIKCVYNSNVHRYLAYSPNGESIAVAHLPPNNIRRYGVRLFDVKSGEVERTILSGHHYGLRSIAFSPDGQLLATAGGRDETSVRVFDRSTGKQTRAMECDNDGVYAIKFSPDGKTLAAAGQGLHLFDVETGMPQRTFQPTFQPNSPVSGPIVFSKSQALIASAYTYLDGDRRTNEVRLWDLSSRELILEDSLASNGLRAADLFIGQDMLVVFAGHQIRRYDLKQLVRR